MNKGGYARKLRKVPKFFRRIFDVIVLGTPVFQFDFLCPLILSSRQHPSPGPVTVSVCVGVKQFQQLVSLCVTLLPASPLTHTGTRPHTHQHVLAHKPLHSSQPGLNDRTQIIKLACVFSLLLCLCVCDEELLWVLCPVRALFTQWGPFHTFGSPARPPVCFSHIVSSPLSLWKKKTSPTYPFIRTPLPCLPPPSLPSSAQVGC